jgi:RNA:NAD 2'-phosphotransferase (TPT1/KptA family)
MLEKIVRNDNKNRYKMVQEYSENGLVWWIRANQGHSIEVLKDLLFAGSYY